MGLRAGLDALEKRRSFLPLVGIGQWFLGCPASSLVSMLTILSWFRIRYLSELII